jgi:uncharacterized protein (TIGR02266 family)
MEITERFVSRIGVPMSPGGVKQVPVVLHSRREILRRYLAEAPHGGLVVEVGADVREEDLVELRLSFGDAPEAIAMRGLVLWCRQATDAGWLAGVGFLASEADTRERMMGLARAPDGLAEAGTDVERRDPRYGATLRVTYETEADLAQDYTRNISAGGLFVDSPRPPEVGSLVLFRLFPPGVHEPIELPGLVVWRRAGQGFGVSFQALSPASRAALESVVRSVASTHPRAPRRPHVEELPA